MNEMSLEEQIRCMQEMRDYLGDFCGKMKNVMEKLQNDIKFLRSQGFSTETEETYQRGYYTPANDDVEHVISDIYTQHFDYIDRVIERLERARQQE